MPDVRQFIHETEHSVAPPSFDTIVARRRERTRNRLIVAAAGCLAVIVAVLSLMSSGWQNRGARIPATPPGFSDGDRWLSFVSPFGVELVHPDGTGRHVLLSKLDGDPYDLGFAHGGSRVAWVRIEADLSRDIWVAEVVNGAVSNPRRLFDCSAPCANTQTPAFSHDGKQVVFGLDRANGSELRIVDARTGVGMRSISLPQSYFGPVWSPDDRHLALTVGREGTGGDSVANIGVIDLASSTSSIRRIDTGGDNAHDVAWSPDGSRLAYVDAPDGDYEAGGDLVTVRPDGSDRKRVTHLAAGSGLVTPTWSPDGRTVYAVLRALPDGDRVGSVDLATGAFAAVRDPVGNVMVGNYVRVG